MIAQKWLPLSDSLSKKILQKLLRNQINAFLNNEIPVVCAGYSPIDKEIFVSNNKNSQVIHAEIRVLDKIIKKYTNNKYYTRECLFIITSPPCSICQEAFNCLKINKIYYPKKKLTNFSKENKYFIVFNIIMKYYFFIVRNKNSF